MRHVAVALIPLALAACAHADTPPATGCRADAVGDLVSQGFTAAIEGDARRRSGARSVRVIRPGQAVTMDFREDRLNVTLDTKERIVSVTCG